MKFSRNKGGCLILADNPESVISSLKKGSELSSIVIEPSEQDIENLDFPKFKKTVILKSLKPNKEPSYYLTAYKSIERAVNNLHLVIFVEKHVGVMYMKGCAVKVISQSDEINVTPIRSRGRVSNIVSDKRLEVSV